MKVLFIVLFQNILNDTLAEVHALLEGEPPLMLAVEEKSVVACLCDHSSKVAIERHCHLGFDVEEEEDEVEQPHHGLSYLLLFLKGISNISFEIDPNLFPIDILEHLFNCSLVVG